MVRSLPTLKQLSPPLAAPATAYAQHRGQTWAMNREGSWRLDAPTDGGRVGGWVAGPAQLSGVDFTGGAFFSANGTLLAFTKTGYVYRVTLGP